MLKAVSNLRKNLLG